MKIKQILEIQKVLGKTIPVDMAEKWVYFSESRDEYVDIMELDIVHVVRILRKYIGKISYEDSKDLENIIFEDSK
tara:strand:+ start:4773 stop:4997 length:225 start_codon:yes stop_codon:yes gene_type:complete